MILKQLPLSGLMLSAILFYIGLSFDLVRWVKKRTAKAKSTRIQPSRRSPNVTDRQL